LKSGWSRPRRVIFGELAWSEQERYKTRGGVSSLTLHITRGGKTSRGSTSTDHGEALPDSSEKKKKERERIATVNRGGRMWAGAAAEIRVPKSSIQGDGL